MLVYVVTLLYEEKISFDLIIPRNINFQSYNNDHYSKLSLPFYIVQFCESQKRISCCSDHFIVFPTQTAAHYTIHHNCAVSHSTCKHSKDCSGIMVDNQAYVDTASCLQNDSYNKILNFGTPSVEHSVIRVLDTLAIYMICLASIKISWPFF